MRRSILASLLFVALLLWSRASAQPLLTPALPPPSSELLAALAAARFGPMTALVAWATRAQPSDASGGPLQALETQVMNLAPGDRDALLYWLQSHGRAALHARGVSDAQIGPAYFSIDYSLVPGPWPATVVPLSLPNPPPLPTPTPAPEHHSGFFNTLASMIPNAQLPVASASSSSTTTTNNADGSQTITSQSSGSSVSVGVDSQALLSSLVDAASAHSSPRAGPAWRGLLFAASTLEPGGGPSQIAITHGFAASRADGTEGVACISFTNNAPQTATELDLDLEVSDAYGFVKRVVGLRRIGTFASGAVIAGPTSVADAKSSRPNCVIDGEGSLDDPTDPFAGAAAVFYTVRQVKYADGTSWLLPGANPWPESVPLGDRAGE
jgi:hypothetical protein